MHRQFNRISKSILILGMLLFSINTLAFDKVNRLGIGMTNQLKNEFPAVSFKMQKNRSFAFGGMFGLSTNEDKGA